MDLQIHVQLQELIILAVVAVVVAVDQLDQEFIMVHKEDQG